MIATKAIDSAVEMTCIASDLYGDHLASQDIKRGSWIVPRWLYLRDPISSTLSVSWGHSTMVPRIRRLSG